MTRRRRTTDPAPAEPIRLVVVEPRAILAVGVLEILDQTPDIEVLAHVATPDEAIPVVDEAAPHVVLVDVALPDLVATEATRRLRQGAPASALIVMGRDDDDSSIVGAVEVGAVGHVAQTAKPAELVATIRRAADGEDPLTDELIGRPDLVERIIAEMRESILADVRPAITLTPRELDVLTQVAAGARNREISEALGISEQTVKNRLSSIFHKLGVPNRTHAVMYAARQGWLVLEDVPDRRAMPAGHG